jgi:predicted oxidoreductase
MRALIFAILGSMLILAVRLAHAQGGAPHAGTEVYARSEVVLAVLRVYEKLAKERGADIDDWALAMQWAEQHTAVNAALVGTGDTKAVVVVILGRVTELGGSRRFRVDLKTGALIELGPER